MHIGLILDGNRRWAKKCGLPAAVGHKKGIENFQSIIEFASELERVETISAFALSTENLNRSETELNNLFRLFQGIEKKIPKLVKHGICTRFLGNLDLLPNKLQESFQRVTEATKAGKNLAVNICVAFGGRDEIIRAAKAIHNVGGEFSEENLDRHLDSHQTPLLDLVVRTGGQRRISNFMIWEAAYAELYFTDALWPEFSHDDLQQAIAFFDQQKRNFGK